MYEISIHIIQYLPFDFFFFFLLFLNLKHCISFRHYFWSLYVSSVFPPSSLLHFFCLFHVRDIPKDSGVQATNADFKVKH